MDEELSELLDFASTEIGAAVRFVPRDRQDAPRPVGAAGVVSVPVRSGAVLHGALHVGSSSSVGPEAVRFLGAVARLIGSRLARSSARVEQARARGARLRALLDSEELSVVYQPILDLRSDATVGVEALSRFSDDSKRPERWFAEAAEVGLSLELETQAISNAVRAFEVLPAEMYMTVNVSPAAAASPLLRRTLQGVPLERLVFEITEHDEVTDYAELNRVLRPLRQRGLRLAVDDAGSGFASLRHILRIQPDIIKLDMSLVRDIDQDAVLRALSYSIATFGSAVGASVVAEGIERQGELNALRFLGIRFGQGFLLQEPATLERLGLSTTALSRTTTG